MNKLSLHFHGLPFCLTLQLMASPIPPFLFSLFIFMHLGFSVQGITRHYTFNVTTSAVTTTTPSALAGQLVYSL